MLVLVEVEDRVATVTLNRPESRNAISAELHGQLDAAITELDQREDVGCIVLTGADPAFCAGMDLKSLATELRSVQQERQRRPARHGGMLPPHAAPVIGAINGPTVTGGLELAMCCDFLIASERASFADTHARVGVMPGGGMTIRLPSSIGIDRACRMSFTGDYIDAETAREWGSGRRSGPPCGPPAHELTSWRRPSRRSPTSTCGSCGAATRSWMRCEDPRPSPPRTHGHVAGWKSGSTRPASRPSARRSWPEGGSRTRNGAARRREGLRGHGPAPRSARRDRPRCSGWSDLATTDSMWPRRCTTGWPSRSSAPSTPTGSPCARASPSPSRGAPRWSPTRRGTWPS